MQYYLPPLFLTICVAIFEHLPNKACVSLVAGSRGDHVLSMGGLHRMLAQNSAQGLEVEGRWKRAASGGGMWLRAVLGAWVGFALAHGAGVWPVGPPHG